MVSQDHDTPGDVAEDDILPVLRHAPEFLALLRSSQVVVVCGDTGSGKTTWLPRLAIQAGCGRKGKVVACTQPRRIAAVSVAARVAAETGTEIGGLVGYRHRYAKKTSAETRIEFMTDGILLAETRSDPLLRRYDAIIVDEAHERSLNIDFLLGILKRLLAKRKDLKVVVSSATLDAAGFAGFFPEARTLSIPGRLFPVDVRYMPDPAGEDADLPRQVVAALATLPPRSDTLVFLPGEREIRECSDAIADSGLFTNDETIPLMASLGPGETEKAFRILNRRRIILATNVAETSLTIPGIKCVVDSGLARIPRFVHRTQVQRLQIERISQASAKQRAGRSGRTAPGICVRLYSEEDFLSRNKWTPPEILRTSLAGVILAMLDLGLGTIEEFPFIDPPKGTSIREGFRELLELGAIARDTRGGIRLTRTGRMLARMPLEPRLARMLLAASHLAVLPDAVPAVAAMACEDPRCHSIEDRDKAAAAYAKFRAEGSDFLGTLSLWNWWGKECAAASQSQLRKTAKKNFLSFRRLREWRELAGKLSTLCREMGLDMQNNNGGKDALHKALMTGLLGRIGRFDPERKDYMGSHAVRFLLHPSSVLAKNAGKKKTPRPEWVMAGELVDTSRLYARNVAAIDPAWIEQMAGDVVKRRLYAPFWDKESGFVRAYERVTLYSLVVADGRLRDLSRADPETSRRLFLVHALLEGDMENPPAQVRANSAVIDEMRRRAAWMRNPSLFDAEKILAHFDSSVPKDIVSSGALAKWLAGAHRTKFEMRREDWIGDDGTSDFLFPGSISIAGRKISLSYSHTDDESDGITATVEKSDANILGLWRHDWLVPGVLPEKVNFILLSLPSAVRRALPPPSDVLAIAMPLLHGADRPLAEAVSSVLEKRFGVRVSPETVAALPLPMRLRTRFRITGPGGKTLACSRNLDEALAAAGISGGVEDRMLSATVSGKRTRWDFGPLPPFSVSGQAGGPVQFKALADEGDGVSVKIFKDREGARVSHERGVARLVQIAVSPKDARPAMMSAIREAAIAGRPDVLDKTEFDKRTAETKGEIFRLAAEIAKIEKESLSRSREILVKASALCDKSREDIETQVAWLVFPGFAGSVPYSRLQDYARYFKALDVRIVRAKNNPSGDRAKMERVAPYWEQYARLVTDKKAVIRDRLSLARYRWLLEEYRISVFAQEIGTAVPASPNRLAALWLAAVG